MRHSRLSFPFWRVSVFQKQKFTEAEPWKVCMKQQSPRLGEPLLAGTMFWAEPRTPLRLECGSVASAAMGVSCRRQPRRRGLVLVGSPGTEAASLSLQSSEGVLRGRGGPGFPVSKAEPSISVIDRDGWEVPRCRKQGVCEAG